MEEQLELNFPGSQLELPLEHQPPTKYNLRIYESTLQLSGDYLRVTLLEQTEERIRLRFQQDYPPFVRAGTELEVRQTELQRVLGITLLEILAEKDCWASSLWTQEGQYVGMGILGTKEKLEKKRW